MDAIELLPLRRLYSEICRGYTVATYQDAPVYIRHFNTFDQTDIDMNYEVAFQDAKVRGVKTEKEKMKWLEERGLWTTKNEGELVRHRAYVNQLEKTRVNLMFPSQAATVDKQLQEERVKLFKMERSRSALLDMTAETAAEQKVQYDHIRLAFYKDSGFKKAMFSKEDMGRIETSDMDDALAVYITCINTFASEDIKRIALQPFFTNLFYLCGEDYVKFFGKPIYELTNYQGTLLSYAIYYRNLLSQNHGHLLSPEIATDPVKLEEYINRAKNNRAALAKTPQGDRVFLAGVTAEDAKSLGGEIGDPTEFKVYKNSMEAAKDRGVTYR